MSEYVIWSIIGMVIYTVIVLWIGMKGAGATNSVSDFLVAGKSVGVVLLTFGVMGAVLSGGAIIGYSGSAYGVGYVYYIKLVSLAFIGIVFSYFVLAKPMRITADKFEVYTLPDYFSVRFNGNKTVRLLSGIAIILGCAAYMVSQFASIGAVLGPLLNLDRIWIIIISGAIMGAYTVSGGMKSSIWTNLFQMACVVLIGVVLWVTVVPKVGGLTELHASIAEIEPDFLKPWYGDGAYSITQTLEYGILVGLLVYAAVPHVSTKFLTTKNVGVLKWAPVICVILYFLGVLSTWPGMAARVLVEEGVMAAPANPDDVVITIITSLLQSPVLCGLLVASVAAAVMSTAESFLIMTSAAIVRDIGKEALGIKMDEKTELKWMRVFTFAALVLGALLSLNPPSYVLLLVSVAWGAFAAMFGPVLYLGTRWRRINSKGAIAGLAVGIIIGAGVGIANMTVFANDPILPAHDIAAIGVVIGTIATVGVSLATKPESSKMFEHFDRLPMP